jgi:isopentenyl-diphosphate Delta-isomerase
MPLDNPNEQFYWVDADDKVLGAITRQEAHSDKTKIHRAVDVVITNDQHQVLLQKRSMNKDKYPGYWTVSAGGHVEYGSTYEQTAARELKEEIGLVVPLIFRNQFIVNMPTETEMTAIFSGVASAASTFLVDPIEVDQVKWLKMTDLSSFARHHKFTLPSLQTFRAIGYLKE